MTTPVNVQIQRRDGSWSRIEVVPLCMEKGKELISTGVYQLYEGFPDPDNIEHFDEESPYFLGELHFKGIAHFEWKYYGQQLTEVEVEHIVDLLQAYNAGAPKPYTDGDPSIAINRKDDSQKHPDPSLSFLYTNESTTLVIRLEEDEGHYAVFINESFSAQLELWDSWEVTAGVIFDPILLGEIIRLIESRR